MPERRTVNGANGELVEVETRWWRDAPGERPRAAPKTVWPFRNHRTVEQVTRIQAAESSWQNGRLCLTCQEPFKPAGRTNRVCERCTRAFA